MTEFKHGIYRILLDKNGYPTKCTVADEEHSFIHMLLILCRGRPDVDISMMFRDIHRLDIRPFKKALKHDINRPYGLFWISGGPAKWRFDCIERAEIEKYVRNAMHVSRAITAKIMESTTITRYGYADFATMCGAKLIKKFEEDLSKCNGMENIIGLYEEFIPYVEKRKKSARCAYIKKQAEEAVAQIRESELRREFAN